MKLTCKACGLKCHDLKEHVELQHGMSGAEYRQTYGHYVDKDGRLISDWLQKQRNAGTSKVPKGREIPTPEKPPKPPIEPDLFMPDVRQEKTVTKCILAGDNVLLVGQTGCGKTSLIQYIAEKHPEVKLVTTKFHTDMVVSDIHGHYIFTADKSMSFNYGLLPTLMDPVMCNDGDEEEYWLLIDELDAAPARVLFGMFGALEDHRSIFIKETKQTVRATPKFRIIASANTKGMADDGRYVRQIFDEAFYDRMSVVECDYTPHEEELLRRKIGIVPEKAKEMMVFVKQIREAVDNDKLRFGISTRRLFDWAGKIEDHGWNGATKLSLLNRLGEEDKRLYKDLIQRHFNVRL